MLQKQKNVKTYLNIQLNICNDSISCLRDENASLNAKIEELNINEIRQPEIKKEELRITVPSLRLDSIIGELANCSRTLASEIIMGQRVFVNYENETQNSKLVKPGDVIVIRGKGKFNILRIDGITKKGKTVVIVEHYI